MTVGMSTEMGGRQDPQRRDRECVNVEGGDRKKYK